MLHTHEVTSSILVVLSNKKINEGLHSVFMVILNFYHKERHFLGRNGSNTLEVISIIRLLTFSIPPQLASIV